MVVTSSQIQRAMRGGQFETEVVKESDMTGGQFNTTQLSSDNNGVLAEIEVGADPPVADAAAVYVGWFQGMPRHMPTKADQSAASAFKEANTAGGSRIKCRLRTSGSSDAQASARFGVGGHKEATESRPNILALQDVDDHDPNTVSNDTDIPITTVQDLGWSVVAEGEFLQWIVNPGAGGNETYQFDEGSSVFRLPVLKWDGRGV